MRIWFLADTVLLEHCDLTSLGGVESRTALYKSLAEKDHEYQSNIIIKIASKQLKYLKR